MIVNNPVIAVIIMPSVLDNIENEVCLSVEKIDTPLAKLALVKYFDEPPKNFDDDAKAPPSSAIVKPSNAKNDINIYKL